MKSNYKKLGSYIRQVNNRNRDLLNAKLMGININKYFMPSVANVTGTDLSKYKIVAKDEFAFNPMHVGRDRVLPISISLFEDAVIVSPAYIVFEILDKEILDPEYLMMWVKRSEFDRNAWFMTDNSVRGGFSWEDFCNMELPVPAIEVQREIVQEYNTIQKNIATNEQIIKTLEDTASTIYKEYFVDFNFPDENGKPYKKSGGKMLYNPTLEKEIPENWQVGSLGDCVKETSGGDWGKDINTGNYNNKVLCIRGTDIPNFKIAKINNIPERYIISKNLISRKIENLDIVIEISGGSPVQATGRSLLLTKECLLKFNNDFICSNFCKIIKLTESKYAYLFSAHLDFLYKQGTMFKYENSTTGVKNFGLDSFLLLETMLFADNNTILLYNLIYEKITNDIFAMGLLNQKLQSFLNLLLSKMSDKEV